jgi:hypothetical protein
VYQSEWMQHVFPYYNVQSLDVVQMPRQPQDMKAFDGALAIRSGETLSNLTRKWELSNTRYILTLADLVDFLNQRFDPRQGRFRLVSRFNLVPKPGVARIADWEDFTAELAPQGTYGLIEFTGALPRAKLYSQWQVQTNDATTLQQLSSPAFNPAQTVFVASPVAEPSPQAADAGTVEYTSYAPRDIKFQANAKTNAVLLLNDRYDADWHVLVDGRPAPMLRCNFLMRGAYLTPGSHTVEFFYQPPLGTFYVNLGVIAVGLLLLGYLAFSSRLSDPSTAPGAAKKK